MTGAAQAEGLAFERGGGELHGGLEPIVFLHGLGSRAEDWAPWQAALPATRPWLAADLRGHGNSPKPAAPVAVADHATDVETLLDRELGGTRPHLVGLSLGSMVSLELAARRADRLSSVFAVSPVGDTRLSGPAARWMFGLRIATLRWFGIGASAHLVARVSFAGREARRLATRRLQELDPAAYRACLEGVPQWQVLDRAEALRLPVTLVRPARDFFPRRASRKLAEALPDARWIELEGARHAAPLEVPERLTPLLAEHLDRVEGR